MINFRVMEEYNENENSYTEISKIIESQLKDIEGKESKREKAYERIYKKIKSAVDKMTKHLKTIFKSKTKTY